MGVEEGRCLLRHLEARPPVAGDHRAAHTEKTAVSGGDGTLRAAPVKPHPGRSRPPVDDIFGGVLGAFRRAARRGDRCRAVVYAATLLRHAHRVIDEQLLAEFCQCLSVCDSHLNYEGAPTYG